MCKIYSIVKIFEFDTVMLIKLSIYSYCCSEVRCGPLISFFFYFDLPIQYYWDNFLWPFLFRLADPFFLRQKSWKSTNKKYGRTHILTTTHLPTHMQALNLVSNREIHKHVYNIEAWLPMIYNNIHLSSNDK